MPHARPQLKWPFHYGWVIAFAGALTLFSCLGLARFAFGVLLPSMREGLMLGYDQAGFISTANFAGYLLSVALAPLLIGRFRPRAVILGGLLLIGACMLGISRSQGFFPVMALYALTGVGSGLANIPMMVLVSHWFRRERRGRAAGLMVMGNGAAIVFAGWCIPDLVLGAEGEGWRSGWLLLGGMSLLIAGIAALLIRNDPAELELEPLGRRAFIPAEEVIPRTHQGAGRTLLKLGGLYSLFGATYMVYGTFIVTTMVEDYGFTESRAGMFWSWVGVFSLFSGVLFGTLSDRIGRRGGLAAVFGVQTVAYLLAGSGGGSAVLLLSVILYGLAAFAIPTIMAAAVGDYLGLSRAAAAFSTVTFFFALGQTAGPGAAGLLAEATGGFAAAYLLCGAFTALAAVLTTLLPPPVS